MPPQARGCDRVHLDTATHSERTASRNAGFIRQRERSHGPLPDKSGVPVVVSRCTRKQATAPCTHLMPRKPIRVRIPVSPSPQPSPLGRGSALAHGFGDCEGPGSSNDGKWFSLSPRERVGVRGKCAFDPARALSKICVRCSRSARLLTRIFPARPRWIWRREKLR